MENVESTAAALASSMVVEDGGADAAEVLAQQLTAVELIGDTAVLESLSADDIIAEVDMQQSSEIAEGQVLMPVKIYVPNGSRVWAKGSYEVVVAIEVDSGTKAE